VRLDSATAARTEAGALTAAPRAVSPSPAARAEEELLQALRAGDEAAFEELVEAYSSVMRRVALGYVRTPAVAEEVVQEAWVGFLTSLPRFEGRSSLKTWILRILVHTAKRRRAQERHYVPFSALGEDGWGEEEPSVAPERFLDATNGWAGHWASPPRAWDGLPENRALSREAVAVVSRSISELPSNQQTVIALRDLHGWECREVCDLLDISEGNQRVLLHRARSKVRRALESYLG
jgi:RNA polymerase sigma-70 factor (ECF subfamily)